eukprot:m.221517 g.221517  ORF g.221517 m.221517 type:complete len:752 (+) comp25803_c0_seq9:1036-3291(+)
MRAGRRRQLALRGVCSHTTPVQSILSDGKGRRDGEDRLRPAGETRPVHSRPVRQLPPDDGSWTVVVFGGSSARRRRSENSRIATGGNDMRPVFSPVDNGTSVATLPPGMSLDAALRGLATMLGRYTEGAFVFEETWENRAGGVPADAGDLTPGEVAAIIAGDASDRHVAGIRVRRFLWRVVKVRKPGRPVRIQHTGAEVRWTPPARVVVGRGGGTHTMTIDEVGVRFGWPHTLWAAPPELLDAFQRACNRRLDPALGAAERRRCDRSWKMLWLQLLFGAQGDLAWWCRERTGLATLLTDVRSSSMAGLSWWGDSMPTDKALLPGDALSLGAFLDVDAGGPAPKPPVPLRTSQTTGPTVTNLFELFKKAAAPQPVELANQASFLGSHAHLAASLEALKARPDLPTALVKRAGDWRDLDTYVARVPSVCRALGPALMAGLLGSVAAVEFPVVWPGLCAGNQIVYSRVDALCRLPDGSLVVVEFKTRWGKDLGYQQRPPLRDLRQAICYGYMVGLQTGLPVSRFVLRYAGVAPDGAVKVTTHVYAFDPRALRAFVAEGMRRTKVYVDGSLATGRTAELAAELLRTTRVMPAFAVLALIGAAPLCKVSAAAALTVSGTWVEHPTGALFVDRKANRRVFGSGAPNGHKPLDAAIKERGVTLAEGVTRCLARLRRRLDRLYGPPEREGGTDSAVAVVIRALNRGVNALVARGAKDAPAGFVHHSQRPRWSRAMVAKGAEYLDEVAKQIAFEIAAVCR